jgi:hypothetical protein
MARGSAPRRQGIKSAIPRRRIPRRRKMAASESAGDLHRDRGEDQYWRRLHGSEAGENDQTAVALLPLRQVTRIQVYRRPPEADPASGTAILICVKVAACRSASRAARRPAPVGWALKLPDFAAVHESGHGPLQPHQSSAFVSAMRRLSARRFFAGAAVRDPTRTSSSHSTLITQSIVSWNSHNSNQVYEVFRLLDY